MTKAVKSALLIKSAQLIFKKILNVWGKTLCSTPHTQTHTHTHTHTQKNNRVTIVIIGLHLIRIPSTVTKPFHEA